MTQREYDIDLSRPNHYAVVVLLARAGDAGMQAGELARAFAGPGDDPPGKQRQLADKRMRQWAGSSLAKRNRLVNTISKSLLNQGLIARGQLEPSLFYHRVPVRRFFITDAGRRRAAEGPLEARRARRLAARNARAEARQSSREAASAALDAARAEGYGPGTPRCLRYVKVLDLRDAGLSLKDIGDLFGVSGEAARLIELGMYSRCDCPRHPRPPGERRPRPGPVNWPRKQGRKLPPPGSLGDLMAEWADVDEVRAMRKPARS